MTVNRLQSSHRIPLYMEELYGVKKQLKELTLKIISCLEQL